MFNRCDESSRAGCLDNFGSEENLPCEVCPNRPEENVTDIYFDKIMFFHSLKKSGYPLKPNQLSVSEWLDLTWIQNAFEKYYREKAKKK